MSDSQRPKPVLPHRRRPPRFDVPDLELEPAPRSIRQPANAPSPNLFDDEAFQSGSLSLDLDPAPRDDGAVFGSSISFEDPDTFEVELNAVPNPLRPGKAVGAAGASPRIEHQGGRAAWPTGRAPDVTQLKFDPIEIGILADYGDAPNAVQLTPAYAYRVFTRQRELKRQLLSIAAESQHAELEREATLAELARAVRPAAEKFEQFRLLFAAMADLEQVADERGQALSTINQPLSAQSGQFDTELGKLAEQMAVEQKLEQDALRAFEEREAAAQRAEAKLKRVYIEIRSVTRVAEQKLGPGGGPITEPEATQLSTLRKRVQDSTPELAHTQAEFALAKATLVQARARLDALSQTERQNLRKKRALGEHHQKELHLRSQGLTESESQQRAALANLGRALLGAAGAVEVPEAWLERVRSVSERADKLLVRREMQARAIDSYDQLRVRQGVQLACTLVALLLLLTVFKLIF